MTKELDYEWQKDKKKYIRKRIFFRAITMLVIVLFTIEAVNEFIK